MRIEINPHRVTDSVICLICGTLVLTKEVLFKNRLDQTLYYPWHIFPCISGNKTYFHAPESPQSELLAETHQASGNSGFQLVCITERCSRGPAGVTIRFPRKATTFFFLTAILLPGAIILLPLLSYSFLQRGSSSEEASWMTPLSCLFSQLRGLPKRYDL